MNQLRAFDAATYARMVRGEFFSNRGRRAYFAFARATHVRPGAYDPARPLVHCWDFNADPLCSVVWQLAAPGVVHVLREFVLSPGTTPQMAEAFVAEYARRHRSEVFVRGDATQWHKTATTGAGDYAAIQQVYERAFGPRRVWLQVSSHNPPIVDRVAAVNAMLRNARDEVRLFVDPGCTGLIRDFLRVVNAAGTRIPDKTANPKLTHLSDALGYGLYEQFPVEAHAWLDRPA